jgi:DNA invertase Pin-like site-specific DNA recombinase
MSRADTNMFLDEYDQQVDEIIAACRGDLRGAVRALMLINERLEQTLQRLSGLSSIERADPVTAPDQACEALKRLAAGEPPCEIALSYNVDHSTIHRLKARCGARREGLIPLPRRHLVAIGRCPLLNGSAALL